MVNYTVSKIGRIGVINPIPIGSLAATLEKQMSYIKQGAEWIPNPAWRFVRLYRPKNGRFPWGLVETVKKVAEKWTSINNMDLFTFTSNAELVDAEKFNKLSPKLRDYQRDAILRLIMNNGGILSLPTGSGKTFTAIEYIKYMGLKTLVIVHTLDLKSQWEKQVDKNLVDVKTYQSIKDKSILVNYGLICQDEVHHVSARTIYDIAMKCGNSILCGLSATPFRDDGNDMKITAAVGEIVYTIDRKSLIDRGFLSNATIKMVSYNTHTNDRFMNYHDIYESFIVNNDERNQKIVDIVQQNLNNKILVLVSQVVHGGIISSLLLQKSIQSKYFHGKIKDRSITTNDNIVIATGIWDEGVDLPDFDVLILAAGGKSGIKLVQRVGRILRAKPGKHSIVYDFIDKSRYLRQHYNKRRRILEEDFEVVDI